MRKYFILLLLLSSVSCYAQDFLKVKNRFNGEAHKFNTNYKVYMNVANDTALYSGWKIEHIKDSSMVLSSPPRYYEGQNFQKTIEVYYSDISFIRFEHVHTEETFYSTAGMVFGGFITILAPVMSQDEKTGEINQTSMYATMIGGTTLFITSYVMHRKFIKRRVTFDNEDWKFEPIRTSKKA